RAALEQLMGKLPGVTFLPLGLDGASEHVVLELPFSFWQYGSADDCARIPTSASTDQAVFSFLNVVGSIALYGDAEVDHYGPYYVQAANELGYPEIDEAN